MIGTAPRCPAGPLKTSAMTNGNPCARPAFRRALLLGAGLAVALGWAYWPTLESLAQRWAHDPQYSHGYVVPVFALIVLWFRREQFPGADLRPNWWGLAFLAAGTALRLVGAYFYLDWFDGLSLLPSAAGLCLLLGGWPALRWAWPAIVFLVFMLPLPYRIEVGLAQPLQSLATTVSTYTLQTLGLPAVARGNIIQIDDVEIGVLEACSGLGMLMTFFALSTAVAFVIRRPLRDKVIVFLSAIPIGVLMNLLRITATGVLHHTAGSELANLVFHDLAGWLMMPLALGALWLELLFLKHLVVPVESLGPVPVVFPRSAAEADPVGPRPVAPPASGGAAKSLADGSLLEIP